MLTDAKCSDMDTRTRNQSQTHMISLEYLSNTRNSVTRFAGTSQRQLIQIIKQNGPRPNCPENLDAKYAEIRELVNRGTFRSFFRAELPYDTNLRQAR